MKSSSRDNKHVRTVNLCEGTAQGRGMDTGPVKLWAFGYDTLAHLFGTSLEAIRKRVQRGTIDPTDLKSLIESYIRDKWTHLGGDLEAKRTDQYVDIRVRGSDTAIFISKEALERALALFEEK